VLIMAVPGVVLFWLPQTAGPPLDIGSVLALASALFFAAGITLVKFLSATHSPIQLVVWANLLSSVIFLPGLIFYWSPPSPMAWAMIITMSLTGLAAQYCYITAMSMGDASFLSPMDYLRLPMAALADYVLFQLLPGRYVWIGAAIIVAATLYITLRETRLKTRG
jgi:drug/metabolite transporter (DMT)-like permease